MRRGLLLAVLSLALLGACVEESRTRIILEDFENASGADVYITLSSEVFVPALPVTTNLTTTVVPSGAVRDVVLLDTDSPQADTYLIYIAIDDSGDAQISDLDRILPVPRVEVGAGDTVTLQGIRADADSSFLLNPSAWGGEVGWARVVVDNNLSRAVSNATPLYAVFRNSPVFDVSTFSVPPDLEGYLRLTDAAVSEIWCFTNPFTSINFCLFQNLVIGDTAAPYIPLVGDPTMYLDSAASFDYLISPSSFGYEDWVSLNDYTQILP